MLPRKENVIMTKADAFSDRILKLYKYLTEERHELVISKQILRICIVIMRKSFVFSRK